VIRADPDLLAGLADDPDATTPAPPPRRTRKPRAVANPLGPRDFPFLAAPVPAWARASGRAGQGDPLFAAGAGLALLDAFLTPRPARSQRAAPAPRPHERHGPRQDAARQHGRRRAARPALRRWRPARARSEPFIVMARSRRPAAQPRPRPDRRRGGAARPWPG
jgi:hypothetical protein